MDEEIIFPFSQPEGSRVSDRTKREKLIRANRFRNRKDNIEICMRCRNINAPADCGACACCIQNGFAKKE